MHHPRAVRGCEGARDLAGVVQQITPVRPFALQKIVSGLPFGRFHHGEIDIVRSGDLINAGDVRMLQIDQPLQSGSKPWVSRSAAGERLESDHAARIRIGGLVQHSCSVLPDLRQDPVMGDGLADHADLVLKKVMLIV